MVAQGALSLYAWESDLSSVPPAAVTITGPCSATYTEQAWMLRMSCKGVQSPQKSFLECWRTEQIQQKEACLVQSSSPGGLTEKAQGEAQDLTASRVRTRNSRACGEGLCSTLRTQSYFPENALIFCRLSGCTWWDCFVQAGYLLELFLANESSASHQAVNFAALAGLNVGVLTVFRGHL